MANYLEISKEKSPNFNFKTFAIILGILALFFTIYITYRASISDRRLFSGSLLALFAGLLFESFRVSDKWKDVIYIFIGTYFFSLIAFLPYKNEKIYSIENHIESWPYFFIVFFAFIFVSINKNKVTPKLSEGITLILSLALIYWTIDYGFTNYKNWYAIALLAVIIGLSAFSILNALSNIQLSRKIRLILSIWSSIIMFAFAIDNIIAVFSNQDIESSIYLSQGIYIGMQFFFLGISAVYIMQNFILIAAFLPDRSCDYKYNLKENVKNHIARFSDKQVSIGYSMFCILYAGLLFGLNYKYHVLPRNTMIWSVLVTFPLILQLIAFIKRRKTTANKYVSDWHKLQGDKNKF